MAVSLKSFQGMASRLGRRPQLLALLRKISEFAFAEKAENYNALLNAYMHVKPVLSRERRHEIIEILLLDEQLASKLIYEDALKHCEYSLAGCRLFFPAERAIFKFWDAQDRPGLWLCFGPLQMHLSPQQVFNRICIETGTKPDEMRQKLGQLHQGITADEYNSWADILRANLEKDNLVALPGGEGAWLHPRFALTNLVPETEIFACDFLSAAVLTLEKIWDSAEYPPEVIAQLPDYQTFCETFSRENHPAVAWKDDFSRNEAFETLGHLFWHQWNKDNGQPGVREEEAEDSGAGVGMEAADEEIDPEECENGDNETSD
jgi:hypothetical protein